MADATRFRTGDHVWVRDDEKPGHVRTPHYIRGKVGLIEGVHGTFRNPELLAYGSDGLPKRALYSVEFLQSEVWPGRYHGAPEDRIYVDIFEQWLEPAPERRGPGPAEQPMDAHTL